VDTVVLCELIDFLLDHDVDGFYVCGNTGEGMLLTEAERRLIAETTIKQVRDRVPVVVHVGTLATATAVRLARHARQAGAYGIASVPPFYVPVTPAGIEEHYRKLAAVAAIPLYLYYIPGATHVTVSPALIAGMLKEELIAGIKFTSYDQLGFREIIELCGPELNVLSGPDEMLLPFLVMGAHGGIGTTYNCMPRLYVELNAAWLSGDMKRARELQYQANRVIVTLRDYGVITALKSTMRLIGIDPGNPRAPLLPLTPQQDAELEEGLKAVGFFDSAP
jgi:N-acetylneuraminate lyase